VTFLDEAARYLHVELMTTKDQVFQFFKDFKAVNEHVTGLQILRIRSDGGGEIVNKSMQTFLREEGIIHEVTAPYLHFKNGLIEWVNRSLASKIRASLIHANFSVEANEARNTARNSRSLTCCER
jgi:hypothetical protein